jgi:hypothetical protein
VPSIGLRFSTRRSQSLNLTYRVRVSGGEWHDVKETVRIVRIPCRFGGSRPYFACPGVVKRLGVEFVSLIEAIGTTTPMSSFIFNIKAVLAELERSSNQRMHPRWAYRQRIEPIASGMQCVWYRIHTFRGEYQTYGPPRLQGVILIGLW